MGPTCLSLFHKLLLGYHLNAIDNKIFKDFLNLIPVSGEIENMPVK